MRALKPVNNSHLHLPAIANTLLYVRRVLEDDGNHPRLVGILERQISDLARNFGVGKAYPQQRPERVNGRVIDDPVEAIVADALDDAGIDYIHESERNGVYQNVDFYLPGYDIWIECKAFPCGKRVAKQLADKENIILIQGREAAEGFRRLITPNSP